MTLPANWTAGQQFTASAENAVEAAVNANTNARPQIGTYASLPAAGNAGALYLCTDIRLLLRDNGTTWDRFNGVDDLLYTPPSSGLTTTTLGTATFAADKGDRLLTVPSVSGTNWRVEYQTLSPTSGYTAEAYIEAALPSSGVNHAGIVLLDSSSGKMLHLGMSYQSSSYFVSAWQWTSATSWNASSFTSATLPGLPNWFRVRDDGTNRYYEYSVNRIDWLTAYSTTRTTWITPNCVGWGGDNEAAGTSFKGRLRSFRITTP